MKKSDAISEALRKAFNISVLEVEDVSEAHRGHAGYQDGGESHFDVRIVSGDFKGMTRIARHRAIHAAIGKDLIGQIHALSLDVSD